MSLTDALNASPYDAAQMEEHNCYTVVDGSRGDGLYTVSFGENGMSPRETHTDLTREQAINHPLTLTSSGKPSNNWEPVEEAES